MNREERQALVSQLVTAGDPVEDIILEVSQEAGVRPETVRKDLIELFPALMEENPDAGEGPDMVFTEQELEDVRAEIEQLREELALEKERNAVAPATPSIQRTLSAAKNDDEYTRLTVIQIAFDPNDGSLLSAPFPHTVNRREWPQFVRGHRDNGVTILSVDKLPTGLTAIDPDTFYDQFVDEKGVSGESKARKRAMEQLGLK